MRIHLSSFLCLAASQLALASAESVRGMTTDVAVATDADVDNQAHEYVNGILKWTEIYPGSWGKWLPDVYEKKGGYYACGAEMRFEDPCNPCDDTAGNAVRFRTCSLLDWARQDTITVNSGEWGNWKGMKMCPSGSYITGAQVRFEDPCGWYCDDTALNGLKISCTNPKTGSSSVVEVFPGQWGKWKSSKSFPSGYYMKGGRVRFETPCGGCDDTAMNGLSLAADTLHYGVSQQMPIGEWVNIGSGNSASVTLEESMSVSNGETQTKEQSYGFSQEISAGFEFAAGPSVSATVGATQAFTTSKAVETTVSRTVTRSFTASCGSGRWFVWQWNMHAASDQFGPGFNMGSAHFICTTAYNMPPKCPLGFCKAGDATCQTCEPPFAYLNDMDIEVE